MRAHTAYDESRFRPISLPGKYPSTLQSLPCIERRCQQEDLARHASALMAVDPTPRHNLRRDSMESNNTSATSQPWPRSQSQAEETERKVFAGEQTIFTKRRATQRSLRMSCNDQRLPNRETHVARSTDGRAGLGVAARSAQRRGKTHLVYSSTCSPRARQPRMRSTQTSNSAALYSPANAFSRDVPCRRTSARSARPRQRDAQT